MSRKIKITDIPADKNIDDFPEDTVFVLDDHDHMAEDSYWEDDENNEGKKVTNNKRTLADMEKEFLMMI